MDIVEHNCPKAMGKMLRYCAQDVRLLEKVFEEIAPYIDPQTSVAEYRGDCPWCGSREIKKNGSRVRATGIRHRDLVCVTCGRQHSMTETAYLKYLEKLKKDG
jgi:transposase-like protein